jgi:hypothetical protein
MEDEYTDHREQIQNADEWLRDERRVHGSRREGDGEMSEEAWWFVLDGLDG